MTDHDIRQLRRTLDEITCAIKDQIQTGVFEACDPADTTIKFLVEYEYNSTTNTFVYTLSGSTTPIVEGVDFIVCPGAGEGTLYQTYAFTIPYTTLGATGTAAGTLTLAANVSDGDTVTIGTTVYTFETVFTDTAYYVLIGATASDSIDNLIDAISGTITPGIVGAGTLTHPDVTAAAGVGDTMDVTANLPGEPGNNIATTETSATASWGAATLTGGSGALGEYVYLAAYEIRNLQIITDTAGTNYRVDIVKDDGSVLSFNVITPGVWEYEGAINEAPITSVTIRNLTATTTGIVYNAVSNQ